MFHKPTLRFYIRYIIVPHATDYAFGREYNDNEGKGTRSFKVTSNKMRDNLGSTLSGKYVRHCV